MIDPLPIAPGPAALEALPALEAALTGTAPVRPLELSTASGTDSTADPSDEAKGAGPLHDDLAVVVGTSGSTGTPKLAMLTARALLASADATHERLGGPGQWLLALPPHHIAGLQVLLRSISAGTTPVAVDPATLTPFDLVQAVAAMVGPRRYASLVPTQLHRLVDDPVGRTALARLDAVLVGGAASDPDLLRRAREHGVRVLTTYGSSETAGGCVYDGSPLAGVAVRADKDGRLQLGGPTLAEGYLGRPDLTASAFSQDEDGQRWFATGDLGEVEVSGDRVRVRVSGRADDLIITGGLKVTPREVEEAVRTHVPAVTDALVVGTPDDEWGQAVSLLAVTSPGGPPLGPVGRDGVAQIRQMLRAHLPAHALPRRVLVVAALPVLGPGKPDRAAAARLVLEGG